MTHDSFRPYPCLANNRATAKDHTHMTISVASFTIEIHRSSLWLETAHRELFVSKGTGVVHSRKLPRAVPDEFASA
ncbi:hypothetical protein C3Y91_03285 [Rhizobium sp. UPM1133]|nr:hypothetical protein [Rhizobium ruizarguesonis]